LYLWYDSTGNDFKSEWINSNGLVALLAEVGKLRVGILPSAHPQHIESFFGKSIVGN
jgi:hypothetical protein